MKTGAQKLEEVLETSTRRARRREARSLALATAGGLCIAVALATLGSRLMATVTLAGAVRALGFVAITLAVGAYVLRRPRLFFASARVPEVLALEHEGERTALASAAEFLRLPVIYKRKSLTYHPDPLIEAHLEQTAAKLEPAHVERRLKRHFAPYERRAGWAMGLGAVMLLIAQWAAPGRMGLIIRAALGGGDVEVSEVPIVGDLSITLRPPAYTGQPAREVRGGDGTIRALVGTSVFLRATSERAVRAAAIDIGEGKDRRVVPLAVSGGRELSGEFVVQKTETYRFVLKPGFSEVREKSGHRLFAEDDRAPQIEIREPAADTELKESGRLMIRYSAQDDFAVQELALVYRAAAGSEQRVNLTLPEARTKFIGDYAFDLAPLGLRPGDEVKFFLEAKDNDTVSGPNKGQSQTRTVRIFSAEKHRRDLLARLKDVVDRLVDQLGDELDNVLPGRAQPGDALMSSYAAAALRIDNHAVALAGEMIEIAGGLRGTDSQGKTSYSVALERSARDISGAYQRKKAQDDDLKAQGAGPRLIADAIRARDEAIAVVERTLIYLEDLQGLATIEELKAQARDLASTQKELKELLKKYRETGDENLKAALEAEIKNLRQKMQEIMQKMMALRKSLPEEFVNREAFARRDMQNSFERIDQLLAENKLDDLAKELERLDNQIHNLERSMDQAQDQFGGERYAELRKDLQRFQDELSAAMAAQKDVQEQTQKREAKYLEEVKKRLGESVDKLVQDSVKDLEAAQGLLNKISRENELDVQDRAQMRLGDARQALTLKDFFEAREMSDLAANDVEELRQILRNRQLIQQFGQNAEGAKEKEATKAAISAAQGAQQKIDAVRKRLSKLFPDPKQIMSAKDMQAMQDLQRKQQDIRQRAQELGERMKSINRQAPLFDSAMQAGLEGAKRDMQQAAGELGQGQAGKAGANQRGALSQLEQIKQAMQKQGQGQGQGIPVPMGGMPDGGGEGNEANDQDKVEIPAGEAFKVPPEFRRDILDAMKQGTPENFKKQVQEFYKELIK